jgi:hypothetical protein
LARAHGWPTTRPLFWDPEQVREERARARTIRSHRRLKRRQQWQARLHRARRLVQERAEKSAVRRAKTAVKAERWREKRQRAARARRERLQAAILNRIRRAFGVPGD